jgi:hypothetical protein
MSISLIAGFILLLIVGSLIVSSISYNRQKVITQQRKEVARHTKTADELGSYRNFLIKVDPDYEILTLLQRQLLGALEQILARVPDNNNIRQRAEAEKLCFQQFKQRQRDNALDPIMVSDDELSNSKKSLAAIAKHLDLSTNAGTMSPATHQKLIMHLKNLGLLIEVESHQHQAQLYADKGDVVLFQSHLKQARDALHKAPIESDKKNLRIRQLTEALTETKRTNKIVQLPPLGTENEESQEANTPA